MHNIGVEKAGFVLYIQSQKEYYMYFIDIDTEPNLRKKKKILFEVRLLLLCIKVKAIIY